MPHNTHELAFINLGYVSLEILRHKDLLDWGLTVAGSVTLLIYNLIRIGRMLRNPQSESGQRKKKRPK